MLHSHSSHEEDLAQLCIQAGVSPDDAAALRCELNPISCRRKIIKKPWLKTMAFLLLCLQIRCRNNHDRLSYHLDALTIQEPLKCIP